MHRIFQNFIDALACAQNSADFSDAMATVASALELSCFAYLALPGGHERKPRLISTYPKEWTSRYIESRYELIDPVITRALQTVEPFQWGAGISSNQRSSIQQQLLDEAAQFGIRIGFTVPIHDGRGPMAALTFASRRGTPVFDNCVQSQSRVLQLMAMYFHAHVQRKLVKEPAIDGIRLSPREIECLEWAAQGKSAWEIGQILGLSRNTVAYYMENAKQKLGVRTIAQAVARLAAANKTKQN
ncbi:LuxR family transcriptional regulator [Bradyrhizobium sp. SZCCHNRI2007]|uniref:LuxR family transcriptional regulator n=1 Tax=Bradyrhizobium sp. SZCCHNRI2007 TaxID=3057281 RepID=UPI0028EC50E4|nr:LuxR family transcriptional regulator [Bradyrhizobium sp. SZCCHNRI2007]